MWHLSICKFNKYNFQNFQFFKQIKNFPNIRDDAKGLYLSHVIREKIWVGGFCKKKTQENNYRGKISIHWTRYNNNMKI